MEILKKDCFVLKDCEELPRKGIWFPRPIATFQRANQWYLTGKETPFLNRQRQLFAILMAMFTSWAKEGKIRFSLIGTSPGVKFSNTNQQKSTQILFGMTGFGKTRFLEEFAYRCFNEPSIWQNFVLHGEFKNTRLPWKEFERALHRQLGSAVELRVAFLNTLFRSLSCGLFFGLSGFELAKTVKDAKRSIYTAMDIG